MLWTAVDTETYLAAPGRQAPRLVCLSYATSDGEAGIFGGTERGQRDAALFARALLGDRSRVIAGHNVAFDLGVVCALDHSLMPLVWSAYEEGRIFDTGIFEMLRKIALGHFKFCPVLRKEPVFSLDELTGEYLGIHRIEEKKGPDAWRLRYRELDGVPIAHWPDAARDYAIDDAILTSRVFAVQQTQPIQDWIPQCRAAWALHLAGCWGLRTDAEAVHDFKESLRSRIHEVLPRLVTAGLLSPRREIAAWETPTIEDFKKNIKVFQRRILEALGEDIVRDRFTTPKGSIQYGEEACFASEDPDLVTYASISKDVTELNTFVPTLELGTKYPISPRFLVLKASGRTGCRGQNGSGQVQNQPRRPGVRECYVPREGNAFVFTDWSAAELVGLAQVFLDRYGHSKLADVLRAGRDPHLVTAANLVGVSYDEIFKAHKRHEKWAVDARQLCKIANFGYPGGLGADSFVEYARAQTRRSDGTLPDFIASFDLVASKRLRSVWISTYPEVELYFRDAGIATSGGLAQAIQHRSGRIRGGLNYSAWCNTHFQGIIADAFKLAVYTVQREAWNEPTSPLWGYRPVNLVHDEIIGEAPIPLVHEMAQRQQEIMLWALSRFCPDVPVKAESAAALRWYKGAEAVHVDGRLVPGKPVKESTPEGRTRTVWVPAI